MKTKIKIILGAILILLCFMNINVITGKGNNSKLSLFSITRSAHAEEEGPAFYYHSICMICEPWPDQRGAQWICIPWTIPEDCFTSPCYYGVCD